METKLAFKGKLAPKQEAGAINHDFEAEEEEEEDEDSPHGARVLFKDSDGFNKKKKTDSAAAGGRSGGGGVGSPCCQAEKCGADLTDAKRYHRRHKVCEVHAKAAAVEVAGLRQRFCQQCSRSCGTLLNFSFLGNDTYKFRESYTFSESNLILICAILLSSYIHFLSIEINAVPFSILCRVKENQLLFGWMERMGMFYNLSCPSPAKKKKKQKILLSLSPMIFPKESSLFSLQLT